MTKYKITYIAEGELYELNFDVNTDEEAKGRLEAEKERVGKHASKTVPFELFRKIA